jgi:cysteine desulfurase/selenocysteine lyase
MTQDIAAKFRATRALFPHTSKVVYFNSASTGPFSTPVRDAINANVELRLACEHDDSHNTFATSDWLRGAYGKLIGAPKRTVGIGLNTSYGLNMAAFGLPLKRGDEILMSDVEFPAIPYTWKAAAEARGLKIKFVKSRERCFDVDLFKKAIGKRSRVLSLSYVQFFNGYKNDIAEIAEICRKHHLYFVVDGIQGMGTELLSVRQGARLDDPAGDELARGRMEAAVRRPVPLRPPLVRLGAEIRAGVLCRAKPTRDESGDADLPGPRHRQYSET